MSRKARSDILFDGCFAHVFSQALEHRFVFEEDPRDFECFKEFLRGVKEELPFSLHHYCLMNTHFHLLVSIPNLQIFSKALQKLKWRYTASYNKKHRRNGPLWRERFKSLLIENEDYLYACGLYIEQNPLKAGMVVRPEDWPHSSSGHYELGRIDPLIDPYEHGALPEGLKLLDPRSFTQGSVIGSDLFKLQVREGLFDDLSVP